MNGKEKIAAAISLEGTSEFPVVMAYDPIYYRDHIYPICKTPWWYTYAEDVKKREERLREQIDYLDFDSFFIRNYSIPKETDEKKIYVREGIVYQENLQTGEVEEIKEPPVGGETTPVPFQEVKLTCREDADRVVDRELEVCRQIVSHDEKDREMGRAISAGYDHKLSYTIVFVPFVKYVLQFGMENAFITLVKSPDLVKYFCDRYLEITIEEIRNAASFGTNCIQIDLGFADMVKPEVFRKIIAPSIADMIDEIHSLGMYAHLNYLGDCSKILDEVIALHADFYRFEDGKKGFSNDIEELADYLCGKVCLQGNLNSIEILQDGSDEELECEIKRMMQAGRKNKGRFIMCTGSPVTTDTPNARIARYLELARRYAKTE